MKTYLQLHSIGILLAVLLLAGFAVFSAAAGSTMMFRMNPQHSGDYSSVSGGIQPTSQQIWTFSTSNYFGSDPAVADGVIYFATWDQVYAIDVVTHMTVNGFPVTITHDNQSSPPSVADGVIYIGSYDGIHAINKDGSQKWILDLGGVTVFSCPAVVGGTIYVGSLDGNVYAITKDGQIKWRYKTGSAVYSSPAVVNDGTIDIVYIGSTDGKVYAIKADGSLKWAFQTGGSVSSSPAVAGGVVYVASYDGRIYAIDAATGNPFSGWSSPFQTGGVGYSSPAVADGVVYVGGCSDCKIYAIDAMTGSQKWAFRTGGWVFSSPAVVNGVVFVGSYDGKLYAIDAITGSQLWTYQTGGGVHASPAFANGVVYVGSGDRKIYAIDIRPVADFTYTPPTLDAPLTVKFTDLSTNNPTSYTWSFGEEVELIGGFGCVQYSPCSNRGKLIKILQCNRFGSDSAKNPSHIYKSIGTYTVTHTASNAGGTSLPVSKTVRITGCPKECIKFPWCFYH